MANQYCTAMGKGEGRRGADIAGPHAFTYNINIIVDSVQMMTKILQVMSSV